MTDTSPLRALALVCSLKPSPAPSSSDLIARQVLEALGDHGVTGEVVRMVDHDVKPGAEVDLDETPEAVAPATATLAADSAHLARPLKSAPYSSAG